MNRKKNKSEHTFKTRIGNECDSDNGWQANHAQNLDNKQIFETFSKHTNFSQKFASKTVCAVINQLRCAICMRQPTTSIAMC